MLDHAFKSSNSLRGEMRKGRRKQKPEVPFPNAARRGIYRRVVRRVCVRKQATGDCACPSAHASRLRAHEEERCSSRLCVSLSPRIWRAATRQTRGGRRVYEYRPSYSCVWVCGCVGAWLHVCTYTVLLCTHMQPHARSLREKHQLGTGQCACMRPSSLMRMWWTL